MTESLERTTQTEARSVITTTMLINKVLKAITSSIHVSFKAFRMTWMVFLISSKLALQEREDRKSGRPLWCLSGTVHW